MAEPLRIAGTDGVQRDLDTATTLPARYYTDPEVFAAEQELIFGRDWIAVAREEDLVVEGDYVTCDVAGEPLVIVRDRDGAIRALANVCRHRNMTIVEGCGNAKALQCPYHRWTYRLDGTLARAPGMQDTAGFDVAEVCLPTVRVETWLGWVFVNLDPDAAPLAPQLTGLETICAPYDLAAMRRVSVLDYPSPFNWKIFIENFGESYHHAGTHPTLQGLTPGEQSWAEDNGGQPWLSLDHVSVVPTLEPFTASVAFPCHTFSILRPSAMLWFRMEVRDASFFDLQIQVFVAPELAGDADVAHLLTESVREINDEDVTVNIRTQRGLRSRYAAPGRISRLERGGWQFRCWLVDRLAPALG